MKPWIKWTGIGLAMMLICLVIGAAVYTQTASFRSWLKTALLAELTPYINGQLQIDRLQGNLWSGLMLEGIRWDYNQERVLEIDRVEVGYNLWTIITQDTARITVAVESPTVHIHRDHEGHWNVSSLITSQAVTTGHETPSAWHGQATIAVRQGTVTLSGLTSQPVRFPGRLAHMDLDMTGAYRNGQWMAAVQSFQFDSDEPAWQLRKGTGQITGASDSLILSDIDLAMDGTNVLVKQAVLKQAVPEFYAEMTFNPVSFDQLQTIIPDLPLYGQATLGATVSMSADTVQVALSLRHQAGDITLNTRLEIGETTFSYRIDGQVSKFNPAVLLRDERYNAELSLSLNANGTGYTPDEMAVETFVDIDRLAMDSYVLSKSSVHGILKNNRLQFDGSLTSPMGATDITGSITLSKDEPVYRAEGKFKNLDVSRFVKDAAALSTLNGHYRMEGQGFDLQTMHTSLDLDLGPLQVRDVFLDTLHLSGEIDHDALYLDEALIAGPAGQVTGKGHWVIQDTGFIDLDIEVPDVNAVTALVGTDSLKGGGHMALTLRGRPDSLHVLSDIYLSQLAYGAHHIEGLHSLITGHIQDRNPVFNMNTQITQATINTLDSLDARLLLTYGDSLSVFQVEVNRQQNVLSMAGSLQVKADGYLMALNDLEIAYAGQHWQKTPMPTHIRYNEPFLNIAPLTMQQQNQLVTISGQVDTAGRGQVDVAVEAFRMPVLTAFAGISDTLIDGAISGVVTLEDPGRNPQAAGWFEITQGRYMQYPFERLHARYSIRDQKVTWQLNVSIPDQDSLITSFGYLPLSPLDAPSPVIARDAPLDMTIRLNELALSRAEGLVAGVTEIQGHMQADIRLFNTLNDLRGGGAIQITDAAWHVPDLGLQYRDGRFNMMLSDTTAVIQDFHVVARTGQLSLASERMHKSQQGLDHLGVELNIKQFPLMHNRKMRAVVDGVLSLAMTVNTIDLQGRLRVPQAQIYYPAWFEDEGITALTERPFFVIVSDTLAPDSLGAMRFQKQKTIAERRLTDSPFYHDLRGAVTLQFPRNTWIRSEEAAIEIEGELQLTKEKGQDFILFGTLSTVRGYYELQGNRFQIVDGQVNFTGNPIINPTVNIDAVHEYFDSEDDRRIKHQLRILITGTSTEPQTTFKIDDRDAEQQDVFAILLFGKPFESLTIGQQARISSESKAQHAITRFISGAILKRMTRQLEKQLRLDLLQVGRGEGVTVEAGKYLTSDVFVSVSQGFEGQDNQRVELEYKLPVLINLFLRALREKNGNNSVDLIWKTEW